MLVEPNFCYIFDASQLSCTHHPQQKYRSLAYNNDMLIFIQVVLVAIITVCTGHRQILLPVRVITQKACTTEILRNNLAHSGAE